LFEGDRYVNTIYIDILFLVNLIINTIIILGEAFLLKLPSKPHRILLGASVGALYSCISFLTNPVIASSMGIKTLCAAIIMFFCFGRCRPFALAKRILVFFALTVALGLGMLFALYFTKLGIRLGGVIKNGVFYFDIPAYFLIICSVVSYFILRLVHRLFKKVNSRCLCAVKLIRHGKTVNLTALVDTGNMLADPFSRKKVLIAEAKKLSPLFDNEIIDIASVGFDDTPLPEGFRIIPFSSIGKKSGLLAAFVPDCVVVENSKKDNIIIAIFNGKLSGSGDYNALIGPDI